jgi:hypothetical protein
MDNSVYVSRKVKVEVSTGLYYEGIVLSTDSDSLVLKDKLGKIVTISNKSILYVREI